jgi:SAM-dependent methyltransferase
MSDWGAQWDNQAMAYLLNLGSISSLKRALSNNCTGFCLMLGLASESTLVDSMSSEVVGINISRKELLKSKGNAELILADAHYLPFTACSFDTIVSKSVLHHFTNLFRAVTELKLVLRQGGTILLYEPGILNPIAFFERKILPTEIHVESERPFIPNSLKKFLVGLDFEIVEEEYFFIFSHIFPVIGKYVFLFRKKCVLSLAYHLDELFCRTFLRNLCWILVFVLRKKEHSSNREFSSS